VKPREFDLYISEDETHVCENSVPWTEGCDWAKPDIHVREVLPIDWEKVWSEFEKDPYGAPMPNFRKEVLQQFVEKQLAGE
jgi:hypothetical protein